MKKIEKNIVDYITNHYEIIMIGVLLILSFILRYTMLNFESTDYTIFLSKWFDTLKNSGGILGLNMYTGDYNAPYVIIMSLLTYLPIKSLYSIKLVSLIFDYLIAILGVKFVYNLCEDKENKKVSSTVAFLILIFLPTIVLNGSMWAQCDVIYTFFIVLSLYFLQKEKYSLSFISLGVSFAFKLQAIFILPLFIILYLKKKNFSILNFLWLPLVNIVLSLPSIIVNKSITGVFSVYFNQLSTYKQLTLNFPNFYNLIDFNIKYFVKEVSNIFGISICLIIFALLLYFTLKSKKKLDFKNIMLLSIISVITCVYFLPHMHERYMFIADVICIIYALVYKKGIIKSIIVELFSLNAYFMYFSDNTFIPTYILSIILLIVLISYIKEYLENIDMIEPKLVN